MKFKVITSSELGIDCWSTLKHFDQCHECNRVQYCKLPEAHKGRLVLTTTKLLKTTELLKKYVNNSEKLVT